MKATKTAKVRVERIVVPQGAVAHTVVTQGNTTLAPQPYAGIGRLPFDLSEWLPEEGDKIEKEGYVDALSLNEYGYVPHPETGHAALASNMLKKNTYCLVRISSQAKASADVMEFRILYAGATGELLATSMAVVAGLKDAFINRTKVLVHAEARQLEVHVMGPPSKSDIYYALQAVELMRS